MINDTSCLIFLVNFAQRSSRASPTETWRCARASTSRIIMTPSPRLAGTCPWISHIHRIPAVSALRPVRYRVFRGYRCNFVSSIPLTSRCGELTGAIVTFTRWRARNRCTWIIRGLALISQRREESDTCMHFLWIEILVQYCAREVSEDEEFLGWLWSWENVFRYN